MRQGFFAISGLQQIDRHTKMLRCGSGDGPQIPQIATTAGTAGLVRRKIGLAAGRTFQYHVSILQVEKQIGKRVVNLLQAVPLPFFDGLQTFLQMPADFFGIALSQRFQE